MPRFIFDKNPDQVALLEELFEACERDLGGEPLGNVAGHARNRLTISWMVLCLCRLLRDVGRINALTQFTPMGARYQDKRSSGYTQAAHLLPCDIYFKQSEEGKIKSGGLYDLMENSFNRTWVQRNIFGATDRVHRLTNLADRFCERGGMIQALVNGCRLLAGGVRTIETVFWHNLLPNYRLAAWKAGEEVESALTEFDRQEMRAAAVRDHLGRPLLPRPQDVRLRSPEMKARAANKSALLQVFRIYEQIDVDRTALTAAAGQIKALRHNEQHR